ncbi:Flagellar basal-body rod protein FlgC [Photobacterium damselae subsp. piscicida]|uniref:Flagellar basal-body rod protein FlgC n=1 Tax=Photobacterium damsela subsp. piscicida TaxID=38294 RepID=A0A1V1V9K8_PHODP|nr:flagellar basal body rod protein FlgC [Photobacterium damselae]MBE8129821.1 flagellar basal body rod protein FlgC [Photobacterium damselae subsp. piscicida]MDP2516072.1 flagellar basal body rod protein FlgC [Photobacterium damselae subsp. piscicida]MDP2545454.1 flagellar basal body rod protein FlgC [Photobacterium damselae subsp. piscicida]PSV79482.1 flagellar basal body rod protein FlgC [Photobacterium damselae]PSW84090.1 flagellar basal body rod protein FlgC [Photobacterium damselae]
MSLFNIFNVTGSAMSAESVRLNTTASNLSNANTVSSSAGETYRARQPIFAAALDSASYNNTQESVPVRLEGIVESQKPLITEYNPEHPKANAQGYIYKPNVNVMEEMANMISASRSYQNNVQVADTSKQMLMSTLQMGK